MTEFKEAFLNLTSDIRPGGKYKKTSITIHSTGNCCSTAKNERDWLDNSENDRDASWHYVVDENMIINAIPDDEEAWHCGKSEGNKHSISIEICESSDRKKTVENAAYLAAKKLKEIGLGLEDIKQHYDWSGKNCPRILRDNNYIKDGIDWNWFIEKVKMFLNEETEMIYKKIDEIPDWGKKTIEKLIAKKYIVGDENGNLNLSEMAVKILVINDRAGLYE